VKILAPFKEKLQEANLDLHLITKTNDIDLQMEQILELTKKGCKKTNNFKFGTFLKEKQKGPIFDKFDACFDQVDHEYVDVGSFIQELLLVKETEDVLKIKKSANLAVHFAKQLVNQMEDVIDSDEKIKHSQLTAKIEEFVEKDAPKYEQKFDVHSRFVDLAYVPIVQSGGHYDLRPNTESNDDFLSYNVIMLSIGAKYFEFHSNVVRTYFIDATTHEKAAYGIIYDAHKFLVKSLTPGASLKKIFEEVTAFITSKNPKLASLLPTNFGYGIGYEFREFMLSISAKCEKTVKVGMVFNAV
jgi:nucleosome binding factor SPN SPT16 subunit